MASKKTQAGEGDKPGFIRRVPPAIFPPILGLLGLGHAWRRGAEHFGVPLGLVEICLCIVNLLFAFALVAYLLKLNYRPGVYYDDMRSIPGRTGLAAMTIGMMMTAGTLAPYVQATATIVLTLAVLGHLWLAAAMLVGLLRRDPAFGPITPATHLIFVGFIVAPMAAIPLGLWRPEFSWMLWYCLVVAVAIFVRTLPPLLHGQLPLPLRPLQAIHLAPSALIASVAIGSGDLLLGQIFFLWATLLFVMLLIRLPWMTAGGFSGAWSAFTFPVAIYTGCLYLVDTVLGWDFAGIFGGAVLILVTATTPIIAFRILRMWGQGVLAEKTNAAIA